MQILTANHQTEPGDPFGKDRGRTKGAEGDYNPTGRTTISINVDPSELPETKPPKSIHGMVYGPWHICSRGLPCLASVRDSVPNSVEICCPMEVDVKGVG